MSETHMFTRVNCTYIIRERKDTQYVRQIPKSSRKTERETGVSARRGQSDGREYDRQGRQREAEIVSFLHIHENRVGRSAGIAAQAMRSASSSPMKKSGRVFSLSRSIANLPQHMLREICYGSG